MSIDQIISATSSVATCVATILVLFTLIEMREQRKASNEPHIISKSQPIEMTKNPALKFPAPVMWLAEHQKPSDIMEAAIHNYSITLFNVGNGTAKNISLKWIFDGNLLINNINAINQRINVNQSVELGENNWLSFKSGANVNTNLDLEDKRDYLLPSAIDKTGLSCRLPISYIYMVSLYIQLAVSSDKKQKDLSIPPITLKISYFDITENKYIHNLKYNVEIVALSCVKNGGITQVMGTLELQSHRQDNVS